MPKPQLYFKAYEIFVKNRRILSKGYNGAPAGLDHCDRVGSRSRVRVPSGTHHEMANSFIPSLPLEIIMAGTVKEIVAPIAESLDETAALLVRIRPGSSTSDPEGRESQTQRNWMLL